MSAAVTIIWDDDSYADAFRQLHAEYQESGYLRDSPGFVSLVGAGRIRERDPGKCSYPSATTTCLPSSGAARLFRKDRGDE